MSNLSGLKDASVRSLVPHRGKNATGEALVGLARTIEENTLRVLDDDHAVVQVLLPADAASPVRASMATEDVPTVDRDPRLWSPFPGFSETQFPGSSQCLLQTWHLAYEGRSVGVLEVRAPAKVLRSKRKALHALVDVSGALLSTATRAAKAEDAMQRTEEILSHAISSDTRPEEVLRGTLQFCARVLQTPIVAWIRGPTSGDPLLLDAFGLLTAEKARTLRRRIPIVTPHELEPPASGHAVAARVAAMLGLEAWPIVCRKDALLLVCGTPETSARELQVIHALLEIMVTLAVASAGAERKSRRLDIALATAVHELKGPLAVSQRLFDILLERGSASSDDWVDLLRRSRDELSHLLSICDTFLRWDMAEDPKVTIRADVGKVLHEVVAEAHLDSAIQEKIRVGFPEDLRAVADEQLLRVAVVNMVRNALDHSPEDAVVDLTADRWGDLVSIEVTDQGPGIAPEEREGIFEPFMRSKASRARGAAGAGLGLFIARRLIEAQRGSIEVHVTQEGTTFRVLIPAAPEVIASTSSLYSTASGS
jgi:signal transduction histidine kinase